jgi:hypothetical protein
VRYTVICVAMKGSLFKRLSQLRTAHGLLIWYLAPFDSDI